MKKKLLPLIILPALVLFTNCSGIKKQSAADNLPPPHILWITTEDISPFLGCYGDKNATTPNLDKLAAEGKRYTNESLNIIWKKACKAAGEDIDLYSGLKHSSCSQYINEKGLSLTDLQAITDHASLESVRKYAKMEVSRKRELMARCEVIPPQGYCEK